MMNTPNDDEKKRREVWFALFGALVLSSFLIFGACQAQIFPGVNAVAQGSLFPVAATATPETATPQPTATATVTPTATLQPTATAVPITPTVAARVLEAPLVVPFVDRQGVTSTQSYSGPTPVTLSGTGQAQGKQFSDAFYLYTDANGKAITPVHPKVNGLLCINSKPIDSSVQAIPAYNSAHTYPVTLNAPGGPLKFGACDVSTKFGDNTGMFTITFN